MQRQFLSWEILGFPDDLRPATPPQPWAGLRNPFRIAGLPGERAVRGINLLERSRAPMRSQNQGGWRPWTGGTLGLNAQGASHRAAIFVRFS